MLRDLSQSWLLSGVLAVLAIAGTATVSGQPALAQTTPHPCHLLTSAENIPGGFGAAYNLFSTAKELLLNVTCGSSSNATLNVGNGQSTTYIYRLGYEWLDGQWKPIAFGGENLVANDWYVGNASANLFRSQTQLAEDNFVVAYTCHWINNQWKCGCRDASCTTNYWQLQAFRKEAATSGGGGSCDTSKWNGTPCPPEPPRSYSLPSGAVRVTNSTELKNALGGSSARDIVLANGVYDNSTYFNPAAAHRLWAENLGGATLKAGILFDSGTGAAVHGIKFDVSSAGKVSDGAIIKSSGSGNGVVVTDSWFEGNGVIHYAVYLTAIHGPKVQRVVIRNFRREGIRIMKYNSNRSQREESNPPLLVADVDVANIKDPDPNCCDGTTESGIWIGHGPGRVERIKVRKADWMCLIPVHHANDVVWRDLDLDECVTAIYIEHYTRRNVFERFLIGSKTREAFIVEWGGSWGWRGVGEDNMVQDGTISSYRNGVIIDVCNDDQTVRRVTFKNQCAAAINNMAARGYPLDDGSTCAKATNNRFIDNDYSGIDAGAKQITTEHHNANKCN